MWTDKRYQRCGKKFCEIPIVISMDFNKTVLRIYTTGKNLFAVKERKKGREMSIIFEKKILIFFLLKINDLQNDIKNTRSIICEKIIIDEPLGSG